MAIGAPKALALQGQIAWSKKAQSLKDGSVAQLADFSSGVHDILLCLRLNKIGGGIPEGVIMRSVNKIRPDQQKGLTMLKIFRRKDIVTRFVVGSILVLVCIAMVMFLIPGLMDPTTGAPTAVVAKVGKEEITAWEMQQSLLQISRRNSVPSEMMPLFISQILNQMVLGKASLQEAGRLGLKVSESELRERLQQRPDLFPGGSFVGREQYEDMVIERFGMSVAQFEQRYRQDILTEKLFYLVTDSLTVTPEEIRVAFNNENEKIVLDYVLLNPVDFQKDISAGDAELEAYYNSNKDRYMVPEKRSAKILFVETQKVRQATTVPEAGVQRYYESNKDNYRIEERVQVNHILLRTPDKTPAKLEEVTAKATVLLDQLKGGADFGTLAKENSEDEATAAKGGDLGWIIRGQTVPEFENVAFSLEPGTISDLIETLYGIHIVQVLAHEQSYLRTFEEVKSEIEAMLIEEKLATEAVLLAEQASAALRRSPADIEALAEQYLGVVIAPPPFAQGDVIPRIGVSQPFLQEVFSLEKDQVGVPVQGTNGYAVPLLLDVFPGHPGEFAEVKDRVKEDYIKEQAQEKARAKGQELAGSLDQQEKKDLQKAARTLD